MDFDQIQLNNHLCNYLRRRLRKTRNVLEDLVRTLNISRTRNSQQRRALTEVELVVKRAEDLESKCMCRQSSWLHAAITLADIKEEVLEIVLDLCFWTSMLKAAVIDSDRGEFEVVQSTAKAAKKHEDLLQKLLQEGSSLQKAAADDRDHLLAKLEKVKEEHASIRSGSTVVAHDREYILSLYLLSRIKEDDQFATDVDSEQLKVSPGIFLGGGASGHVSEVTWLQQKCALKVLKVVDKIEATILRGCNHPHIVRFLWYWEHQKRSHIMMEWMPKDLYKHIEGLVEKNGSRPFPLHVAIDIMLQIAKGMRYLHNKKPRKIVHRDLKTSNILVQPSIDSADSYVLVKLADFGTSKFYNMTETPSLQTSEKGTTVYAAPEVFQQKQEHVADKSSTFPPKADVWSFAMVCSEILTGKMPFIDMPRTTLHADIKRLGIRPDLPPDCPRDLHFCITRCWDANPRKRPTFVEVCKMLKLAKARSLGVIHIDVHKVLLSADAKSSLDINMPLTSDKPTTLQLWRLFLKNFLHLGGAKRRNLVGSQLATAQPPIMYSYKELKIATKDFDPTLKLGEGGFSTVYKGVLPDGDQVAVKCLHVNYSRQIFDDDEFQNEIVIMAGVTHKNIVRFKGYCIHTKGRRFLVHEFVQNNSLAKALFGEGNHALDWPTRQNICLGVVHGVRYLHESIKPCIIHRDIKPENILLDEYLHAKIADFGVSRHIQEYQSDITTKVVGTWGYLAPEYITNGRMNEKIDVYAVGIVLLEVVSGKKVIFIRTKENKYKHLVELAYELYKDDKLLELVDSRLNIEDHQTVLNLIHVGLLCVQSDPSNRPSMAKVMAMLEGEVELEVIPHYMKLEGNNAIFQSNWNWSFRRSMDLTSEDCNCDTTTLFEGKLSPLDSLTHDLTTTNSKDNQSREKMIIKLAQPIMSTKGKEPMEQDEMLDHDLTTNPRSTIGVNYEAGGPSAPPPRQPSSSQALSDLTWCQGLEARMSGIEGMLSAMCLELKEMHKLLITE